MQVQPLLYNLFWPTYVNLFAFLIVRNVRFFYGMELVLHLEVTKIIVTRRFVHVLEEFVPEYILVDSGSELYMLKAEVWVQLSEGWNRKPSIPPTCRFCYVFYLKCIFYLLVLVRHALFFLL